MAGPHRFALSGRVKPRGQVEKGFVSSDRKQGLEGGFSEWIVTRQPLTGSQDAFPASSRKA